MMHIMFRLHGDKVRAHRERQHLTQEELADRAGMLPKPVSRATIQAVEEDKRPVSEASWLGIAEALGLSEGERSEIVAERIERTKVHAGDEDLANWIHRLSGKLDKRYATQLAKAIRFDMEGRHDLAIRLCREIIEERDHIDFQACGEITVRLATFLDNAGNHVEAHKELQRLTSQQRPGHRLGPTLRRWAEYHLGICLVRLGRLDEAESVFLQLEEVQGPHRVGAMHQLGVIDLQRALLKESTAMFRNAEQRFKRVRIEWAGTHREAYPLRRLGQLRWAEGRPIDAITQYIEALVIFAKHRCDRYVEETKEDLRGYISSSVSKSHPPTFK
jgi:transcriptional regulator with XRE-family HTH domain